MNRRFLITIIVVVILGIIAVVLDYAFFSNQAEAPVTDIPNPVATPEPSSETPSPNTDDNSALNECITLKKSEAEGKGKYLEGTLLVGFQKGTKLTDAESILKEYNLSLVPTESTVAENNLTQYGWLAVEVPKGEEFRWQCLLGSDLRLRNANLNYILDFHE